jgi:hypothetical protein
LHYLQSNNRNARGHTNERFDYVTVAVLDFVRAIGVGELSSGGKERQIRRFVGCTHNHPGRWLPRDVPDLFLHHPPFGPAKGHGRIALPCCWRRYAKLNLGGQCSPSSP